VSAVSPQENDQQAGKEKKDEWGGCTGDAYESVWRECGGDGKRETSEEATKARARTAEAVPSAKEVGEHNLDHSVCRSRRPRCAKGRAEGYGHKGGEESEREAPVIGIEHTHMHSEQEREEEKGMPIAVMKDEKIKMITAKVVPSRGVDACAVESVRKAVEQVGHRRIVLKSDNEPAILA
jgi:hypothetical protein